ncbi:NADH-cytochrome b5 reductase 1 [Penicillium diatomitis]|uniref:NADH-cytochrome b5 reductase 1 n=1 Tax=Penicillium diatomitis TaxID=2819901 RepID=A0A9X0BJN3_9EURO|nr:NADH-cytochrome b5 reductase 1 [Penicillium diatomitis]KAJ5469402.1 NADH-cytochrome b5 reductase 1 [Penicillium diatomitis]
MAASETTELKAQWKADTDLPEYSMQDVAAHNSKNDTWIVIHGQVFDITEYLQDHPGGAEILVEVAGKDATADYEDVGHSEDAREIMQPYLIGVLKDAQQFVRPKAVRVVSQSTPEAPKSSSSIVGPVAIVTGTLSAILPALYIYRSNSHLSHRLSSSVAHLIPRQLKGVHLPRGGFVNGFLAASLISGVVGFYAAKQLNRFTKIESNFMRYPPRIKAKKVIRADPHLIRGFLQPQTYQDLPLIAKVPLSPNVYRFVFGLPDANAVLGLPIGQHVALKAEVNGTTVTRSYTPTSNNLDRGRVELVVKCYPDGLMSQYLAGLEIGDRVPFRGPKGSMKYTKDMATHIGMVAGGTGITPMYQLIRAICENDNDTTQISLVYANRTEADILLREELDTFARRYPNNFKVWYMLDSAPQGWAYGEGFVNADVLRERMPAPGADNKILLCGPPGMIGATKKNLATLGFKTPGSVSKMSDEVFCF